MSEIAPGWYKDPAEPTTQRYWDGEGWIGESLPIDATPPPGPPASPPPARAPARAAGSAQQPPSWTLHPSLQTRGAPGAPPVTPPGPSPAGGQPPTPSGPVGGHPLPPPGWPAGYPYPLTRRSPAPRPHGYLLASPFARLVARMIDIAAVFLLCVVANSWFGYQFWQAAGPTIREIFRRSMAGDRSTANLAFPPQTSTLILMILLVTTAVWFAYEVPGSANSGQTLGKRLLRIKVMRIESEDRLGFGRAWRRWSRLGLPTMLWYCFCVGLLLQLVDCLFVATDRPLHQAIHDKAAGTVVVRVTRLGPGTSGPTADAHGATTTGG